MLRQLSFFILAMLASMPAFAGESTVVGMLASADYASLETHFAEIDNKFREGGISERELVDSYRDFYRRDESLTDDLNGWVAKRPKSFYALLCRGVYFRKQGELIRGEKYVSQTPPDNLIQMHSKYVLAKQDLESANRLRPLSYVLLIQLLNIAQFEGDHESARRYLDLANKALPSNVIARARFLIGLSPRWGGSYSMMDAFVIETKNGGASEQIVRWLQAIELEDRGMTSMQHGDSDPARERFRDALRLSADADRRFRTEYLRFTLWYCIDPNGMEDAGCLQRP